MRVNVYAEEMTDRVEIISKRIDGHELTGLRFYLELPATINLPQLVVGQHLATTTVRGPFIHRPGDDDSSAVTFWGKQDFRDLLRQALQLLDEHYRRAVESERCAVEPEHEDCASERCDFDDARA